jgi:hypothetical protein
MNTRFGLGACTAALALALLSACGGGSSDALPARAAPPAGGNYTTAYTLSPSTFGQFFDANYNGQNLTTPGTGNAPTTFNAPAGSKGIQMYVGDGTNKDFGFAASVVGKTLRITKLASDASEVRVVVNFKGLPGVGDYSYDNCTPIYLVTGVTTTPTDYVIDLASPATGIERANRGMACSGTIVATEAAFQHVDSLVLQIFKDGPSTLTAATIDSAGGGTPAPVVTYADLFTASTGTFAQYFGSNGGVNISGTGAAPTTFTAVNATDTGLQVFMGDGTNHDLSAKTSMRLTGLSTSTSAQVRVVVNFKGLAGFGNNGDYGYDNCTAVYVVNTTASAATYTVDLAAPNGAANGAACGGTAPSATQALSKVDSLIVQSFQPGTASLTLSSIQFNQ